MRSGSTQNTTKYFKMFTEKSKMLYTLIQEYIKFRL